jgi:hypothetical protein
MARPVKRRWNRPSALRRDTLRIPVRAMHGANCATENRPSTEFSERGGRNLVRACAASRGVARAGARLCDERGRALTAMRPDTAGPEHPPHP